MQDMLMFKFCLGCCRIVGGIRWREGQKEQCVLIGIFDKPSCTVRQRHFNVYPFRSTLFFLPHMFLSNSTFLSSLPTDFYILEAEADAARGPPLHFVPFQYY